ncbi:MAG TPA: 6-phosphogluconolactonase [Bacteroidales bacterium]|nr:6-phosphogluconolactonase [Bacteroidales bacterium]
MHQVKVLSSEEILAEELAKEIALKINSSANSLKPFSIALAGGSTPKLLYSVLAEKYAELIPWNFTNIFMGDERCVPFNHPESNFGMIKKALINKIRIPEANIHPVKIGAEPEEAANNYSEVIDSILPRRDGMPVFDLIILGLGEDGHTASVFPDRPDLINSKLTCEAVRHPQTGQCRITLTFPVINNANAVFFLVTGEKKAAMVREILNEKPGSEMLPAKYIDPVYGILVWFMDENAGRFITP